METLTRCPLCSADFRAVKTTINVSGWTIVTCPGCGAGITNPRPTPAGIGRYYRASFFSVRPDARVWTALRDFCRRTINPSGLGMTLRSIVLNEIKYRHDWTVQGGRVRRFLLTPLRWMLALTYEPIQWLPGKPGAVLDIGFGRGEFLQRAKRLGWECHGVEVSPTSVEWGRSLGFHASQFDGSFQQPLEYPDNRFDLISANSVLEHVHDPRRLFEECRRLLKPGGTLFLMVPNFECRDKELLGEHWRMWYVPQHLFHFTAENIATLLAGYGFGPPRVTYKIWYNPYTEKFSLASLRPTLPAAEFRRVAWQLRIGKRWAYLRGKLTAAQVGPGMALEATKTPNDSFRQATASQPGASAVAALR